MSNLQMIEGLCSICEELSRIVWALSSHLAEVGDTYMTDEIAAADARYRAFLGTDELPDNASVCPGPQTSGPGHLYQHEEGRK